LTARTDAGAPPDTALAITGAAAFANSSADVVKSARVARVGRSSAVVTNGVRESDRVLIVAIL